MKRGDRVVHGDKELIERLGRNDPCPCGSGRRFQAVLRRRPGHGDALFDLATLTLGHEEHGDVAAGYGTDVDRDLIRAWWSLRCLLNVRWLVEHGFGPPEEMPEVAVLRSRP